MAGNIDARTANRNGDANELRRVLMQDPAVRRTLRSRGHNLCGMELWHCYHRWRMATLREGGME